MKKTKNKKQLKFGLQKFIDWYSKEFNWVIDTDIETIESMYEFVLSSGDKNLKVNFPKHHGVLIRELSNWTLADVQTYAGKLDFLNNFMNECGNIVKGTDDEINEWTASYVMGENHHLPPQWYPLTNASQAFIVLKSYCGRFGLSDLDPEHLDAMCFVQNDMIIIDPNKMIRELFNIYARNYC